MAVSPLSKQASFKLGRSRKARTGTPRAAGAPNRAVTSFYRRPPLISIPILRSTHQIRRVVIGISILSPQWQAPGSHLDLAGE
ncbi:unnamed protein product [Withania somnifera]